MFTYFLYLNVLVGETQRKEEKEEEKVREGEAPR